MDNPTNNLRLALLIDADNASPAIINGLLSEISKYGVLTVKRIYGDWTTPNLGGWKATLLDHSIVPIQQFRYTVGKNATDTAMIIDAMDILYNGKVDGFCLVSSDSDFTRLASRIRESGLVVYGFGERKTPSAFVSACDKFIFVDILTDPRESPEPKTAASPQALKRDAALMNLLRSAIDASADEAGWANLGGVGKQISSQKPDFDSRHYGSAKLSSLLEAIDLFEIRREPKGAQGHTAVFVRNKSTPKTSRKKNSRKKAAGR
jgi:uncharacterized LabA/DUF88 family protein